MSRPSFPVTKSTAAASESTTSASGVRLCSAAHCSEVISTAEAPSVSGVELPAVMVASPASFLPKTGFRLPSFSTVESGRMLLSLVRPLNLSLIHI